MTQTLVGALSTEALTYRRVSPRHCGCCSCADSYEHYQRHICESQCTDCRCQYAGRYGQNFGLLEVTFGLGFIVGPALGGIIGLGFTRSLLHRSGPCLNKDPLRLDFFRKTLAPENRRPFKMSGSSLWGANCYANTRS